jgi:predicted acyltransferase (DUF342 family)
MFDFIIQKIKNIDFFIYLFFSIFFIPIFFSIYYLNKIKNKKDDNYIEINLNYKRDPAYFGKTFLNLLNLAILNKLKKYDTEALNKIENLILEISLFKDKKEIIYLTNNFEDINKLKDSTNLKEKDICSIIIMNKKSTEIKKPMNFKKEFINLGNLIISNKVSFFALIVKGDLILNKDSEITIEKYLHVDGNIYFNSKANVGGSIYSSENIYINSLVTFKRMFAKEIKTQLDENFVFLDDIEENKFNNKTLIKGNLKIYGKLELNPDSEFIIIQGNLVSENDIILKGNIWVKENIFTQGNISLSNGVVVGVKNKIKSIVAKKNITIGPKVKIYGYIHSELNSTTNNIS